MTIPFSQAKYFSPGRGAYKPHIIVIHTMETPENTGRAKQVWQWFAGKTAPQASAHYMTDSHDVFQSVKETDTAWAVDDFPLNQQSISIELAGSASQTPAQWADSYSRAELKIVAQLCADIAKRWNIPIIKLSPADILAGKSGFCGHVDITVAKQIKGGHTDPGSNFPWADFIASITHTAPSK